MVDRKEVKRRISSYWSGRVTSKAVPKTPSDFFEQEKEDITMYFWQVLSLDISVLCIQEIKGR